MTMDKSLHVQAGLTRSRSVLSRAERIARLQSAERWTPGDSPLGLPKVRVFKLALKKKKVKKEEGEGDAAATTAAKPAAKPAGKPGDKKK